MTIFNASHPPMRLILLAAFTFANGVAVAQTTNPSASTTLNTKASIQTLPTGISKITTIEGINDTAWRMVLKSFFSQTHPNPQWP